MLVKFGETRVRHVASTWEGDGIWAVTGMDEEGAATLSTVT